MRTPSILTASRLRWAPHLSSHVIAGRTASTVTGAKGPPPPPRLGMERVIFRRSPDAAGARPRFPDASLLVCRGAGMFAGVGGARRLGRVRHSPDCGRMLTSPTNDAIIAVYPRSLWRSELTNAVAHSVILPHALTGGAVGYGQPRVRGRLPSRICTHVYY